MNKHGLLAMALVFSVQAIDTNATAAQKVGKQTASSTKQFKFGFRRKTEKPDQPTRISQSTNSSTSAKNTIDQANAATTSSYPSVDSKKPYLEPAVKHYNRGVELHQSGFLNQAIGEYKAALEADQRLEEAYSNLGLIYAAQRSYPKAIEAFNQALVLKPARPTTLNGLGTVLYAKGRTSEAMEKWKQSIAADPQFVSAYYNMGNALESEKHHPEAIDAYVKAIKINPAMADAYFRIGTICNKNKHPAQANILLSKAIELSPNAEFAYEAKKQLSSLAGQLELSKQEEPVKMNMVPPATNPTSQTDGKASTVHSDK